MPFQTSSRANAESHSVAAAIPRRLQRACACGAAAGISGPCSACAADEQLGVQAKLAINPPADRWEQEADRIAEQVVSDRHFPLAAPLPVTPLVQRQAETLTSKAAASPAPAPTLDEAAAAVGTGGRPFSAAERDYFEPRFGRELSSVRIHDGSRAGNAARGIGARAYTLGRHIAFAPNAFDSRSKAGRRLIAHELAHTIQQTGGDRANAAAAPGGAISRAPDSIIQCEFEDAVSEGRLESYSDRAGAEARMRELQAAHRDNRYRIIERGGNFVIQVDAAPPQQRPEAAPRRAEVCDRPNTQVSDFPDTYIERIDIDLGNLSSGMSLTWNRATRETRALRSSFPISPGAGLCSVCCDDAEASRNGGSLCTPKGTSRINRYGCRLGSTAWARNASYFEGGDSRSGIAIHTGNNGAVPSYPASHGCIRTTNEGAAIVFDNSADGQGESVQTTIAVGGTWNGNRCYERATSDRRSRTSAERCGGRGGRRSGAAAPEDAGETEAFAALAAGVEAPDLAGPA